jgi:RNA-directed DNA polymerase
VYQHQLFPTEAGTPQGGIISPVLANMTLDGLEKALATAFPRARQQGRKMNMVRYADDFIITGHSKEWLEQEVMPVVTKFLKERGLSLSQEKTRITHIPEGFDFLGWNMRKYGGKLLIKPSKQSIRSHLSKVWGIIKANKAAKQVNLIGLLNPVLRGWANYHRHAVAKKTFASVDSQIWFMLWQWAKRRHPKHKQRGPMGKVSLLYHQKVPELGVRFSGRRSKRQKAIALP